MPDRKAARDGHLKSISVIEIVNDDMPFLVDSVMGELTERGLAARLIVHPILAVERDKTRQAHGAAEGAGNNKDESRESFIHVHVARVDDARAPRRNRPGTGAGAGAGPRRGHGLEADARPRRARSSQELKANPPPVPVDDIAEAIQFLEWLAADNFTLFGVRDYAFKRQSATSSPVKDSGLGILRDGEIPVFTARPRRVRRSRRKSAPFSTSRRR